MLRLASYSGNPYLGVFCVASEEHALLPLDAPEELVLSIEEALDVKALRCSIDSSNVVGSLVAMNSNGAIVSGTITANERASLPEDMNVQLLHDRLNAAGNNILANDNGAIFDPGIGKRGRQAIADALGVECVPSRIAGIDTVGAICHATNKGVVCHPAASDEDLELIRDVLKVDAFRSTLNHGSSMVGSCLVANSKGALVGDLSTPIELGRLEDALRYY